MSQKSFAYVSLFVGVVAVAFSPIFVSLAQVNGLTATLYRSSVASGVLLVPFLLQRENHLGIDANRPSRWKVLVICGVGGLLFALNNALFNTAVTLMSPSRSVFLANTSVLWVGLLSMVLLREKLSLRFWGGLILALAGVFLITAANDTSNNSSPLGNLIALSGGFFYGLWLMFNSTARRFMNALAYMVFSNLASSLILLPAIWIAGAPIYGFSMLTYLYLIGLGVVSHAFGFWVIIHAQAYLPASTVSTILLMQPPLVLLLSMILLHERPLGLQLAGMAVLLCGIILANQRKAGVQAAPTA